MVAVAAAAGGATVALVTAGAALAIATMKMMLRWETATLAPMVP